MGRLKLKDQRKVKKILKKNKMRLSTSNKYILLKFPILLKWNLNNSRNSSWRILKIHCKPKTMHKKIRSQSHKITNLKMWLIERMKVKMLWRILHLRLSRKRASQKEYSLRKKKKSKVKSWRKRKPKKS